MAKTTKTTAPLFHRAHYNILANQFKENWPPTTNEYLLGASDDLTASYFILTNLAISMAVRFKKDNPSFDPSAWLNQCSPDPKLLPLGTLWKDRFLLDPEDNT